MFFLFACSSASVSLGGDRIPGGRRPDDDTGTKETSTSSDTSETGDTAQTGDTSWTDDTGIHDTSRDTGPICLGISVFPLEVEVFSGDDYEEITVTLTGCATGISATNPWAMIGDAYYSATWTSLPAWVNGEMSATVVYQGSNPTGIVDLAASFSSDQGDTDIFYIRGRPQ